MKKILLATALFLCANSTFAAETAILKIKGTLTASACTPEFSNGGVVDYGNIRLGELSSTAVNQLGQRNIDLTITCTAATKVAWNMIDDRADSNAGLTVSAGTFTGGVQSATNQTYGVGKAGTVNIGSYAMFMKVNSVTADGKSVDPIYQQNGSTTWAKSTDGSSQGENNRNITVALSGSIDPLAFQTATFPLVTSLAIQNTTTLAITDDTRLDGQLTISLKYL
ncbi:DUF1120 domain-containing protein [Enterobacter cloacae]|uniref:DUF1120 domain-containing protein n=1 Tax=Enterobacter cloacae TaxID=550 RepID=UPI000BA121F2|nr:DUF1120 domain-containing protein [Enterobacter cloacae]OZU91898.1 hypothetical protein CIW67_16375 [Enterobacter cloacae]PAN81861.1 hypothetical protein CIW66_18040 [Enterobacter cloacae]PAN94724.1 hypothetical protein CIW63_18050 [Enterobacter cloacae]HAS1026454.1 DUF1120 domain-containing protein [Enterobacter cloacae]HAS1035874.1 DUF1120 domain-containing protein [Enterobacter cloacae]